MNFEKKNAKQSVLVIDKKHTCKSCGDTDPICAMCEEGFEIGEPFFCDGHTHLCTQCMGEATSNEDFPKKTHKGQEYYVVGCKKCCNSTWEVLSDEKRFIIYCLYCGHISEIDTHFIEKEPEEELPCQKSKI